MNRTKIEWVVNPDGTPGFANNAITGCWGPGGAEDEPKRCPWCYAHDIARHNAGKFGYPADDPFRPTFHPKRLEQIRQRKKPATIFMVSMGDAWGEWAPTFWIKAMLDTVRACPQHRFIFLTKNPQRYLAFSPFPANVAVGATATDQQMATEALSCLGQVEAPVRFLSCEPLLGRISLPKRPPIDWLIIGALSLRDGRTQQPDFVWCGILLNHAGRARIPVFMKDELIWPNAYSQRPKRREFPPLLQPGKVAQEEAARQLALL
jgi:protein gp37